jgi:hypothetical protein
VLCAAYFCGDLGTTKGRMGRAFTWASSCLTAVFCGLWAFLSWGWLPPVISPPPSQEYFKPYGELVTLKVYNRGDRDPSLKGQAFVQLKTQELAQKAAAVRLTARVSSPLFAATMPLSGAAPPPPLSVPVACVLCVLQELASVPLKGQAVKLGTMTSGGSVVVSATGETWEVVDGAEALWVVVSGLSLCPLSPPLPSPPLPSPVPSPFAPSGPLLGFVRPAPDHPLCLLSPIPVSHPCPCPYISELPPAEKSNNAQDRASLIAQLSNAVQQEAVGLGATIVPGGRGKPKPAPAPVRPPVGMPPVVLPMGGVVPGFPPNLAFPIPGIGPMHPSPVPVGLPSRAIVLKNMFDPAEETEEGWDLDIAEDVKEECEKHGPVLHVGVQKDASGQVYVLFR